MLTPRGELLPLAGDYYLWKYVPSVPAAAIFIVLFLLISIAHTWKMYRFKMWFCTPFVVGGYLEVVGYGSRVAASNATNELMPFIIQSTFLLVPPSLFAASIYMTLGRIIRGLGPAGEACSLIRVRRLTTTFVLGDLFTFLIQSGGAGLMAMNSMMETGKNIVIAGLVLQVLFFGLFVVATVTFHVRFRQHGVVSKAFGSSNANLCRDGSGGSGVSILPPFPWESMLSMLYGTSALILVRSVFRVIEYIMGTDGYLLANEWPLYVFDGVLMFATMTVFYIWYPSEIRAGQQSGSQGAMELQSQDDN
ncbi:RTA1 like protein-domain-containing protein, partial [Camillea tinctor]